MASPIPARGDRKRLLFVAEAVTLAHVARPAALQAALDPLRYEIFFACDPRARRFLTVADPAFRPLHSLNSEAFADRLRRGVPLYLERELQAYVEADRALLAELRPDFVVGDFRLSLSVSARLAGVPYATISNAYWSPWAADRRMPLPVLPWTRYAPLALGQRAFDLIQPLVLKPHDRPLNRVRVAHGLPPLPGDLRQTYTDADHTLYADAPALFPTPGAPATHLHLGPVIWSPPLPLPPWWDALRSGVPLVYVTMGSSGRVELLELIFEALTGLGVEVIASTAGARLPRAEGRPGVHVADYLPGTEAAARAALVVCNGGSPTSQQAIAGGTPVLGICANMDQMLNMRGLQAAGLGAALRTDRLSVERIRAAAGALLGRDRQAIRAAAAAASQPDSRRVFANFIQSRVGAS